MSWKKLFTALRGATNEGLEAAADSQSLRILDQELRDAKEELRQSDAGLITIAGKRKLASDKVNALKQDIERFTQSAISASEKGDDALAVECATRVAELESDLETEDSILQSYLNSESVLKQNIAKAKNNVRRLEQQVDQVKATASVQKAQASVSNHHSGSNTKVKTAMDSLDRIKEKQKQRAAELEAAEELAEDANGTALEAKLKAAGIGGSAGTASGNDKLAQILAAKKEV